MMSITGRTAAAPATSHDAPVGAASATSRHLPESELSGLREFAQRACKLVAENADLGCVVMLAWTRKPGAPTPIGQYGRGAAQLTALAATVPEVNDRALLGAEPRQLPGAGLVLVPLIDRGAPAGVMLGRRRRAAPPLSAEDCHRLSIHGEALGLAAATQVAALRAQRLEHGRQRVALARSLHETVVQRICAASMVMSAGPLEPGSQDCCVEELRLALAELRATLLRSAEAAPPDTGRLTDDLTALRDAPGVTVRMSGGAPRLTRNQEGAARAALAEAVRNARKHGGDRIRIAVDVAPEKVTLDVVNATRPAPPGHVPGIGLRLTVAEAGHNGVYVHHGPEHSRRWRMQLVAPITEEAC